MANFERTVLVRLGGIVLYLSILGSASQVAAFQSGVTTLSFGSLGCNQCHSEGQDPTLTLSGPSSVDPNSINEYILEIQAVGAQTRGGLNVSAAFGALSLGGSQADQTQLQTGTGGRAEITHVGGSKAAVDGVVSFSFLWTAPGSFTSVTLNAWGNALNGNGLNTGDKATLATLTITSTAPGSNPTNTFPPTPTPTPTMPMHDSVVAPVKPLSINIAAGATTVTKKLSVKVTNADAKTETQGHTVQLAALSDCPAGVTVGAPDFGSGATVVLAGGQSKSAKIALTVSTNAFTTLNGKAANRCTLMLTASSPNSADPTPANNIVTAELNVIDKNDPAQPTVDESFIQSLVPVTLVIPKGAPSKAKTIKPTVGNADILPVPEKPGDTITVSVWNGDCPAELFGSLSASQVIVKGGAKQGVSLPLTATSAFTTASKKSPARCTALVKAAGPADPDPDATNNSTRLVVDVIDNNDF